MDNIKSSLQEFFRTFSTPILFVCGVVVTIILVILHNKYYVNYFFPELNETRKDSDFIKTNTNNRVDKYLIKGLMPLSNSEIQFNTYNKLSPNYVKMPISINNDGGSQYTYSFWINKLSSPNYADRIILLKGLKNDNIINIKSPIIKFGQTSDELEIGFNTIKNIHNEVKIDSDAFNITGGDSWYLVNIVFVDYVDYKTKFEKGVNVLVYLNGSLIKSESFKNDALKLNDAPFYILPNVTDDTYYDLRGNMSNLMYHNYALSQYEIENIYKEGPNTDQFKTALEIKKKTVTNASEKIRDLHILNETTQI